MATCVVCQRRPAETDQVCAADRQWLDRTLREVVELYALLDEAMGAGVPVNVGEWTGALWIDREGEKHTDHLDPVALALPGGPITTGRGQRVSGSREAPLPLRINPLDLTMPVRATEPSDEARRWPEDQLGELSVASRLDSWVSDWRSTIDCGDVRPAPTVVELVRWLRIWLERACDQHPAIYEFAHEIKDLRRTLRAVVGINEVRPERLDVPCRRCDLLALHRLPGEDRVECGSCGDLLTEDEFTRWLKMLAPDTRGAHRMADLPKWVWDVVVNLQMWVEDNPQLHGEVCACVALAAVPDEVKVQARVLADYLRKADVA